MEFLLKKNPGIKWSEAMFLSNFTQDLKNKTTLMKERLLNSKVYSQFVLNLSTIEHSSIRLSTTTTTYTDTTGYQAGQEPTNPQLEYSMSTNKLPLPFKTDYMSSLFNVVCLLY